MALARVSSAPVALPAAHTRRRATPPLEPVGIQVDAVASLVAATTKTRIVWQVDTSMFFLLNWSKTASKLLFLFVRAALSNPRTTRKGRRHAKEELVVMVSIPLIILK